MGLLGDQLLGLSASVTDMETKNGTLTADKAALTAEVAQLKQQLVALPAPIPPTPPTLPQLPGEIPVGTDVAITDLVAKMNASPVGTVFRVKPGALVGATLPYKSGQQVWALDPPNTLFDGNGVAWFTQGNGVAPDTVSGFLRWTRYCPADPTWTNVSVQTNASYRKVGGFGKDSTMPNSRLYRCEAFENGRGINGQEAMLVEQCILRRNHHLQITAYGKKGIRIIGGEWAHGNIKPAGGSYYTRSWEVSNKFIACTDLVIDGVFSHHNVGPGIWTDINNDRVTIRNCRVEDNKETGIFHEVSFQATIEGNQCHRNAEAANILVSNCVGTSANPIRVRNNNTSGHGQWEIALSNSAHRPLSHGGGYINFIEVVSNTINAGPNVAALRYHKYGNPPVPTSIVQSGNKRPDGSPITMTYSASP